VCCMLIVNLPLSVGERRPFSVPVQPYNRLHVPRAGDNRFVVPSSQDYCELRTCLD
jgi:hypothetical protein